MCSKSIGLLLRKQAMYKKYRVTKSSPLKEGPFNQEKLHISHDFQHDQIAFAFDVGGSLCKIAYPEKSDDGKGKTLIHMITYSNAEIEDALLFIERVILSGRKTKANAICIGVGSRALKKRIENLGVNVEMSDEFKMFSQGLHYMLKNLNEEDYIYPYQDPQLPPREMMGFPPLSKRDQIVVDISRSRDGIFPVVLGFCGSGLAFVVIHEDGEHSLVGGTLKGGLFFYSLGCQLTGASSYAELYKLASDGDATAVTTTLEDLEVVGEYGDLDFGKTNAASPFVMESFPFGNLVRKKITNPRKADLARALMHTVCDEINLWSLILAEKYGINRIFMTGSFLRNNDIAKKYLERFPLTSLYIGEPVFHRFLKYEPYKCAGRSFISYTITSSQKNKSAGLGC